MRYGTKQMACLLPGRRAALFQQTSLIWLFFFLDPYVLVEEKANQIPMLSDETLCLWVLANPPSSISIKLLACS